jgi:hypothetical protein
MPQLPKLRTITRRPANRVDVPAGWVLDVVVPDGHGALRCERFYATIVERVTALAALRQAAKLPRDATVLVNRPLSKRSLELLKMKPGQIMPLSPARAVATLTGYQPADHSAANGNGLGRRNQAGRPRGSG